MNRNLTFSLPAELIKRAKVYAAENDTTVNAIVRDLLHEKVTAEGRTRAAAQRFLELARTVPSSPVDPRSFRREELHERG